MRDISVGILDVQEETRDREGQKVVIFLQEISAVSFILILQYQNVASIEIIPICIFTV